MIDPWACNGAYRDALWAAGIDQVSISTFKVSLTRSSFTRSHIGTTLEDIVS